MPSSSSESWPSASRLARRSPIEQSVSRALVETFLVLFIGMLLIRGFAAEAYIVPTGSMAPTLLGAHRDLTCKICRFSSAIGIDEAGRQGHPLCPNCGADLSETLGVERTGDRLLVQKHFFRWRTPQRWEVVVFLNPNEPGQAFVKRVVALPGESIEIKDGDIYINGQLARKDEKSIRAMRLLVHDSKFRSEEPSWFPRWIVSQNDQFETGWQLEKSGFVHRANLDSRDQVSEVDWLEYQHVDPDRAAYGPIRDYLAYNGARVGSGRRVHDLMVEAQFTAIQDVESIAVRFGTRSSKDLRLSIPLDGSHAPQVTWNQRIFETDARATDVAFDWANQPGSKDFEASFIDHRLIVKLNGESLFEPLDLMPLFNEPPRSPMKPVLAFGVTGGALKVNRMRVYRDIFYTDGLSFAPGRPHAVGDAFRLGSGEYFVLGDNSPISNDSRFWPESPVVKQEMLVGKPFLVHLPSRAVPLRVFGSETYWLPDLREIRYIR